MTHLDAINQALGLKTIEEVKPIKEKKTRIGRNQMAKWDNIKKEWVFRRND